MCESRAKRSCSYGTSALLTIAQCWRTFRDHAKFIHYLLNNTTNFVIRPPNWRILVDIVDIRTNIPYVYYLYSLIFDIKSMHVLMNPSPGVEQIKLQGIQFQSMNSFKRITNRNINLERELLT